MCSFRVETLNTHLFCEEGEAKANDSVQRGVEKEVSKHKGEKKME